MRVFEKKGAGIPPAAAFRAQGNGGPGMFGPRRHCRATDRLSLGGRNRASRQTPFGALRGLDPLRLGDRSWAGSTCCHPSGPATAPATVGDWHGGLDRQPPLTPGFGLASPCLVMRGRVGWGHE
jgi:hypothetical protein